jgi:AraC family transcriptional regulator, regulatory protein of adaptative response / methylated-DNA-[protein]-cysteine methyltransferase
MADIGAHKTRGEFVMNTAPKNVRYAFAASSLGTVLVAVTDNGICAILLGDDAPALERDLAQRFAGARLDVGDRVLHGLMAQAVDVIEAPGKALALPLDPHGSPFELRVWHELRGIPAGATASYSEIALRIGAPREAYAVGEACAANMIAVAIPCHRVLRKDGGIAGYRWGVKRKRALLAREGAAGVRDSARSKARPAESAQRSLAL